MSFNTLLAAGKGRNLLTWQVDKKIPGGMNLQPPLEMDPIHSPQTPKKKELQYTPNKITAEEQKTPNKELPMNPNESSHKVTTDTPPDPTRPQTDP